MSKTSQARIKHNMEINLKTHHRILLTGAAGGLGTTLRSLWEAQCGVLMLSDKYPSCQP